MPVPRVQFCLPDDISVRPSFHIACFDTKARIYYPVTLLKPLEYFCRRPWSERAWNCTIALLVPIALLGHRQYPDVERCQCDVLHQDVTKGHQILQRWIEQRRTYLEENIRSRGPDKSPASTNIASVVYGYIVVFFEGEHIILRHYTRKQFAKVCDDSIVLQLMLARVSSSSVDCAARRIHRS